MQYLLLVIALAVAVALSIAYVPMREGGSSAEFMPDKLERMAPGGLEQDPAPEDAANRPEAGGESRRKSVYYRWRDADGSWHYGQRPPAGVDEYERIESDPVTTKSPEQIQRDRRPAEGSRSP